MKNLFNLLCVCVLGILSAQNQTLVYPEWVRNYSDRDSMTNIPAAIDANGNVYVTGSTYAMQQGYNITTVCYNSAGTELWAQHYNGSGNQQDIPNAIIIDNSGDIIITGRTFSNTSYYDFVTLKYNSSGTLLWSAVHNSGGQATDVAQAITLDNNNNIYVAGYFTTATTSLDYAVVRYNPSGAKTGVFTFNGAGNGADRITSIAYNSAKLYLTGYSTNTAGRTDILTMCVNTNNGNVLWSKTYNGLPFFTTANIYDAKLALSNNALYVIGTTENNGNYDFVTIKYNLNNGNQLWAKTYDGYGESDYSSAIALSGNDIFVTGRSRDNSNLWEYHTIKYNQAGVAQWINKFSLNTPNISVTNKVAYDSYGMIYVCGEKHTGSNRDMLLVQISANGTTQWNDTYNGTGNSDDAATDMVIDSYGVIYLCGQTYNGNAKFDYTTVKLRQTFAYKPPDLFNQPRSTSFDYVANQGQLINTNDDFVPEIKYYVTNTYPALYFTNDRLSYVFAKADTSQATQDTLHRIDMTFENGNPLARVFAFDTTQGITNYFLAHCPQGITGVKGYERLFVPDIFPNIDVHYYSNNAGLKMYFVLKPGASAKGLNLLFDGQDNLSVVNDNLIITSSIGSTYFERPHAYMVNWGQQTIPVNWQPEWKVDGNRASLITGSWNGPFPLVIVVDKGSGQQMQPQAIKNLEYSTFYGESKYDRFADVKTFSNGYSYITGYSFSNYFPNVTAPLAGNLNSDAIIIVNNNLNVMSWTARYGGGLFSDTLSQGTDYSNAIAIDSQGNAYITGTTQSNNLPLADPGNGAYYDDILNGNSIYPKDMFVAKFNGINGDLLWSTYFGGTTDTYYEQSNAITVDIYDNIYIAGRRDGNTPLKNMVDATNDSTGSCFIAKFNSNDSLIWSTAFGGNSPSDQIQSIITDHLGRLIVTGGTKSSTSSFDILNAAYPIKKGLYDAFLALYDELNFLNWSTFFGGDENEIAYGVTIDKSNNIFITGFSRSETNFPIFYPIYPTLDHYHGPFPPFPFETYGDIFVAKFSPDGYLLNSILYGGSYGDVGFSITVDKADRIYVAGQTGSSDITLYNENPTYLYSKNFSGNPADLYIDGVLTVFTNSLKPVWSTYFGGGTLLNGASEWINSVAVFDNDYLYIIGATDCKENNFPLVDFGNGAYYQNIVAGGSYDVDGFLARFNLTNLPYSILDNYFSDEDVNIYPNPANDYICVSLKDGKPTKIKYEIINLTGQFVQSETIITFSNDNIFQVSVSGIANGIYFLKLSSQNNCITKKIIIE